MIHSGSWARIDAAEASEAVRQRRLDLTQASVYFEPNVGQADPSVRFVGRTARYSMLFEGHGMTFIGGPYAGSGSNQIPEWMRFEFGGCEKDSDASVSGLLPGKSNYFIGNSPDRWHSDVPHYTRVDISEICPGIAVSYHGKGSNIEYDLTVAPGADPAETRINVSGTRRIELSVAGELVFTGSNGEIRHSRPVAYQTRDGVRSIVAAAYKLLGDRAFSFDVGTYDHSLPLVIDPVIVYSTYLGGPAQGSGWAIAVDGSGSAYVTGNTQSLAFPLKNPVYPTSRGNSEVTVTKFDPSGSTLIYSTYLGSSSDDLSRSIAVDAAGNAYVAGMAGGSDFPTAHALQSVFGGNTDAFVTKISPDGSSLVYSTFLGGNGLEDGLGLAVDAGGSVFITGRTTSANFPVASAYQGTFHGTVTSGDAFLAKIDPAGTSLQFSTFFGGSEDDTAWSIVLDALGGPWIGGWTSSGDLPVLSAFQAQFKSQIIHDPDGFVAHFSNTGALLFSSFIGGSQNDSVLGLAIHPSGDIVLLGETESWSDFPVVQSLSTGSQGECFIARVNPTMGLVFSSLFAGVGPFCGSVAVNPAGEILVVGAASRDFPVATELAGDSLQNLAIYLAKVANDGSHLVYSTFLGYSTAQQNGRGIALDSAGAIYIVGDANQGIPIVNAFQPSSGGYQNYAVAKLNDTETCSFSVSPNSFTIPPAGGSGLITVTTGSNCLWNKYAFNFANSAQNSDAGTLDSSGFLVKGNGTVSFQLGATSLGPDVSNTALVAGRTVSVTQTGLGCNYTVNPGPDFFTQAGGSGSVAISANSGCKATASSNANWISIPSPEITSGGSITYNVQPNADVARSGTISVAGLTHAVNQAAACNSRFDSAGQDFPRIGGGGTVHVLAPSDCAWSITNDNAGTLNISSPFPPSGTGNATIVFSASDNNFQVTQVAHLHLSSGATFTVTVASPCSTTSILVNAGGPAYTDSVCKLWSPDSGFLQGASYSTTAAITGTTDPTLYQSEHYSTGNLTYQTSVPNGSYTVKLKFAELYWTSAGQRVFNVQLNGAQVATNVDVFAAAGGMNKAYDVSYPITVSGGQVTITLVAVAGFPAVNAIEIAPSAPPTPDFTVTATPPSQTLTSTGSTTYTVTATVGAFSGTMSFSVSGLPTGATASFNPPTVTGSGSTTLTVNTTSGTPVGSSPLTVTATSGSLTHTAMATLVVSNGTVRVNAGGLSYTDSQSQVWTADTGFQQGANYSTTAAIIGTNDPTLYRSEHYSTGNLTYQTSVPNGNYTVKLRFAELYWTSSGQRVFNVQLNGTQVATNLDVFVAAGGMNKAYDVSYPITVSGGQITITFAAVAGFPAVNGIEIAPFAPSSPDFTLAAIPPSQNVHTNGITTYTLTTTALGGFGGTVSFNVSGLPSGSTASFSPQTVSGSGSTTLTVSNALFACVGSSILVVMATSGSLSHTATITLNVTDGDVRVNAGGPAFTDSQGQVWSRTTGSCRVRVIQPMRQSSGRMIPRYTRQNITTPGIWTMRPPWPSAATL